jgi:hypothetical protein
MRHHWLSVRQQTFAVVTLVALLLSACSSAGSQSTTIVEPPLPGIPPCVAAGTSPVVKPTTVYLACATGGISVVEIKWQSWGRSAAFGEGTLNVQTCQPNCAQGGESSYAASIEVSDPSAVSGVPVFQDVSVLPKGAAGPVESANHPGGWGAP